MKMQIAILNKMDESKLENHKQIAEQFIKSIQ